MQLARNKHQRSMAKILAVLALLCTAALQLQEVGHEHWLDLHDSYAECLLCKGSGAAAVNDPEASAVLFKSASGAYEHVPFVKVTNLARAIAELKGSFQVDRVAGDQGPKTAHLERLGEYIAPERFRVAIRDGQAHAVHGHALARRHGRIPWIMTDG